MKVILAGHTGVEKTTVAKKLKQYLPVLRSDWMNRVHDVDVEDWIKQTGGGDPRVFAGISNSREQRIRWLNGWEAAKEELDQSGALCQIIKMHLSFANPGRICSPVDLAAVAAWQPDLVITLIDDVYSIKRRTELQRYPFSLSQLYWWRTTEKMLADQLAILSSFHKGKKVRTNAYTESLLLAVKHPVITAARLIANLASPRVYSSYPITSTRVACPLKEEINTFRHTLHGILATFDPVTIEELPLLAWFRGQQDQVQFQVGQGPPGNEQDEGLKRWDSRLGDNEFAPLVWEPQLSTNCMGESVPFFPISIPRREFQELMIPEGGEGYTTIHEHVTARDLRLVSQSDFLVCYRPYFDGSVSGGVNTEIQMANSLAKEVVAYVGNDTLKGKPLRGKIDKPFANQEQFWGYLREAASKSQQMPRPAYY